MSKKSKQIYRQTPRSVSSSSHVFSYRETDVCLNVMPVLMANMRYLCLSSGSMREKNRQNTQTNAETCVLL